MMTSTSMCLVGTALLALPFMSAVPANAQPAQDNERHVEGTISGELFLVQGIGLDGTTLILTTTPMTHTLAGDVSGSLTHAAQIQFNPITCHGEITAPGWFQGTVLGGEPGVARLDVVGATSDCFASARGTFTLSHGTAGLDGISASGTFEFELTPFLPGTYSGEAMLGHYSAFYGTTDSSRIDH